MAATATGGMHLHVCPPSGYAPVGRLQASSELRGHVLDNMVRGLSLAAGAEV